MCAGNCGPDLEGNRKIEAGKTERTAEKAGNLECGALAERKKCVILFIDMP